MVTDETLHVYNRDVVRKHFNNDTTTRCSNELVFDVDVQFHWNIAAAQTDE